VGHHRGGHARHDHADPRHQYHQATITAHVNLWGAETADRIRQWTEHFMAAGADAYTAQRRAVAMLYRDTVEQAHVLAYGGAYFMLTVVLSAVILLLPRRPAPRPEPAIPDGRTPPRAHRRRRRGRRRTPRHGTMR
jgi:hypothetical protein